jgi:putative ABC transport system permease protein
MTSIAALACANVANLFIVRVAQRQRELSIRTALGAGAGQLVRQLLTESILLSLLGGVAGIILAVFGVKALVAANPADLPRLHNVGVDGEVLLFGCAIAILSGIVFGLGPAMHVARGKIADTMKLGGRHSAGRSNTRKALLIGEVALSLILVVGSGLLLQSFARLVAVNPGFHTERVLTVDVPLLGPRYSTAAKRLAFHAELATKLQALPGVTSIGATNALPLTPRDAGSNFAISGRPPLGYSQLPNGRFRVVTPGYFDTLRIQLRAGRFIAETDSETAPGVVVINETMARQYWPGEDPLGKRITLSGDKTSNEIIGIIGDVKHYGLDGEVRPEMYFPYAQQPQGNMTVVLRSAADPESLTAAVRSEVRRIDPDQPLTRIQTLDEVLSRAVAQPRFYATLLSIFSVLALVLAAVGIYGVMSFGVSQRVREMGIRMALGASAGGVLRLSMKEGVSLTGIGIGLGVAGGLACSRVLGKLLFGIAPTDLVTFAGAVLLIVVTAATACYLPARRATRVDPAITLRGE